MREFISKNIWNWIGQIPLFVEDHRGMIHKSVTPTAPSCIDISWRCMLMTSHGGSATVPRRIRRSGNVRPRAAAASGRRLRSAPQPLRANGNEPWVCDRDLGDWCQRCDDVTRRRIASWACSFTLGMRWLVNCHGMKGMWVIHSWPWNWL